MIEHQQIHYQPPGEGVIMGRAPNAEMANIVGRLLVEKGREVEDFEDFLETTPNLNEKYGEEINLAEGQFKKDGLPVPSVVVLSKEDFGKAVALSGEGDVPDHVEGQYVNGVALIAEDPEKLELFGPDYILGNILHEGAHATVTDSGHIFTSKVVGDATVMHTVHPVGGFHKYRWGEDTTGTPAVGLVGRFWEEGFADRYRVRGLREMGRSVHAEGARLGRQLGDGVRIAYYGDGESAPLVNDELNCISLPASYAGGVSTESQPVVAVGASGIAGYSIEVLEGQIPGIFDDMIASRQDAAGQARFIGKLEQAKPGLYREISELSYGERYTEKAFSEGLRKIAHAFDIENQAVTNI